jgi:sulfur-carrier protein
MRSSERDRAGVKVRIPDPLRSYTNREKVVEADGGTVEAVLADLDRQFPGIRFRMVDEQNQIRKHMKVFVNDDAVRDLATPLRPDDEVTIMQALSGG